VNPDNLSVEVQNELAVFAATLINSVRQQFGLSAVEVTQGAQEFARTLTRNYKATHGNTVPFFNYNQPGKNGHIGIGPHDRTIIEQAATSVGLKANDDNMYENIGFFDDVHTVNGIKRSIYNSIKYMLFTDFTYGNTFGHTVNLLRSDKTNPSAPVYLGVSTETVGGLNTHYVI
ncbi:SEC10/PgrA surface exclusion domain-containing protein, partial [Streptococcus uberis]